MQDIFTEGFARINENFAKTFTELFGGGQASLSLSERKTMLESGIDINVKLPGKNVPSLDGLSGGEKALIALSIYFAIMRVNAPPFCFLDEVDTALDDINVDRFADYMIRSDFFNPVYLRYAPPRHYGGGRYALRRYNAGKRALQSCWSLM